MKKGKAKMSEGHFEKKESCKTTGGGKYSGDNVAELKKSAEGLASFAKKNKPSRG